MTEMIKKVQVFDLKINEPELNEIVSMLMDFPGGRVYNILRKIEDQTTEQRKLPLDKGEFEDLPVQKKEGG